MKWLINSSIVASCFFEGRAFSKYCKILCEISLAALIDFLLEMCGHDVGEALNEGWITVGGGTPCYSLCSHLENVFSKRSILIINDKKCSVASSPPCRCPGHTRCPTRAESRCGRWRRRWGPASGSSVLWLVRLRSRDPTLISDWLLPRLHKTLMVSSVLGSSHGSGPTLLCHTGKNISKIIKNITAVISAHWPSL